MPLLVLTPLVLVLGRSIAIDDTLFLGAAEQILKDPWRPFDAVTPSGTTPLPLWIALKNPPGLAYWLAAGLAVAGHEEWWLHLMLLPFALAAALAGVRLGRRFLGEADAATWATAAWLASPAFLVSASTLTADVPALALVLWATALWIDGVDGDRAAARRLGAALVGLALVVKYTAVLMLPLLALYVVLQAPRERRAPMGLDLWPAFSPSLAWALVGLATHGRMHVVDSLWIVDASWLVTWREARLEHGIALLTCVAAAGVFPVVLLVPALGRSIRGSAIAVVAGALGLGAAHVVPSIWRQAPAAVPAAAGVLVALGAAAVLVAGGALLERRDPGVVFVAVWFGLWALFVWGWSWTVAARFVLPLLPPLAWLLALAAGPARRWLLPAASAASLAVSAVVIQADMFPVAFHRAVVDELAGQAAPTGQRVYFVGGGTVLYYGERIGMRWLDPDDRTARAGDLLLHPYWSANSLLPQRFRSRIALVTRLTAPVPPLGIHTMNPAAGAGFYASAWGPLPFAIASLPAGGANVWRITADPAP